MGGIIVLLLLALFLTKFSLRRLLWVGSLFVVVGASSWYLSVTRDVPTVYEVLQGRYEKGIETGGSGRLKTWDVAEEGFTESFIIGQGGRYTLRKIGRYTHNDYLEMLANHGLIGFAGMIVLFLYILLFIAVRYRVLRPDLLITSCSCLFPTMLVASLFFTIYYNPYIWFVVAILFSRQRPEQR